MSTHLNRSHDPKQTNEVAAVVDGETEAEEEQESTSMRSRRVSFEMDKEDPESVEDLIARKIRASTRNQYPEEQERFEVVESMNFLCVHNISIKVGLRDHTDLSLKAIEDEIHNIYEEKTVLRAVLKKTLSP